MSEKLEIRLCPLAEAPALMSFIDRHWRSGHILSRDEALLRWQFAPARLAGAAADELSVLLACRGGKIVGMLGLIPFEFNFRGRRAAGAWLANWLALPEVTGAGLTLMETARKLGCEARFAFGIGQAVEGLYGRMGFEVLPRCPRWVAVLDAPAACELIARANPAASAEAVDAVARQYCIVDPEDADGKVAEAFGELGGQWNRCWETRFAPRLVGGCRDAAYINWRYVNHPRFHYEKCFAYADDPAQPTGLAIWRIEPVRDMPHKVLRIVEFLADGPAAVALARAVLAAGRRARAALADFYCTCPAAAAALEDAGFRRHEPAPDRPAIPARFQPLDGAEDTIRGAFGLGAVWRKETGPLLTRADFYVTKSDDDMDRPN